MKVKYLKDITSGIDIRESSASGDLLVRQIAFDSRRVDPGTLFVAIRGYNIDGHHFLAAAQERGAGAAVVEDPVPGVNIPQIRTGDSREALARLAVNFYREELAQIRLIGITGTNGKTTTSFLIKSVLDAAGLQSGLIGTIHYDIANHITTAWNTTPESIDICRMLADHVRSGGRGCVLEVSSHALRLKRVAGLQFEVAVFTNLTQDHLDFHEDMQDYFSAKKELFKLLSPTGRAVLNLDDPFIRQLNDELDCDILSFGRHPGALIAGRMLSNSLDGVHLHITTPVGDLHIRSPLIGSFNQENICAAIGAGLAMNLDLDTIQRGIEAVRTIPGRLEVISWDKNRTIVIDYAHTPDALRKSLAVLRSLAPAELSVVFGCGGDRDRDKRPKMGNVAADFADQVFLTSDNPRSEDPDGIINDILNGIPESAGVIIEPDRRKAIITAMDRLGENDTLLIAGKGHEGYQEIRGIRYPFNDKLFVKEHIQ